MISTVRGCVRGLLGGAAAVSRLLPLPCACHRPRSAASGREAARPGEAPAEPAEPTPLITPTPSVPPAPDDLAVAPVLEPGPGGEVPPGPWRWRWVWPTPGRPAGAALVAADGTLVLWSPGGFAEPGRASDGRPTPDVADALAALPDLVGAAAGVDALRAELERARVVADETRRVLSQVADAVDDELERAARPDEPGPNPPDGHR